LNHSNDPRFACAGYLTFNNDNDAPKVKIWMVVSNIFYVHLEIGEDEPILTTVIFFKGVGSTTNQR